MDNLNQNNHFKINLKLVVTRILIEEGGEVFSNAKVEKSKILDLKSKNDEIAISQGLKNNIFNKLKIKNLKYFNN